MCFLADLNSTVDEQFDALLMSNVVPMYPEFKSESLDHSKNLTAKLSFVALIESFLLFQRSGTTSTAPY